MDVPVDSMWVSIPSSILRLVAKILLSRNTETNSAMGKQSNRDIHWYYVRLIPRYLAQHPPPQFHIPPLRLQSKGYSRLSDIEMVDHDFSQSPTSL